MKNKCCNAHYLASLWNQIELIVVISLKALFLYSLTLTFREAHVNHICFIVKMVRSEWDMQEQQLSKVFLHITYHSLKRKKYVK